MIVGLGKVFGITMPSSVAKSITGAGIARQAGRAVASNVFKMIPGGIIGASTAAALTEMLGWVIADNFYRMSQRKGLENIVESASDLKGASNGLRFDERIILWLIK